MKSRCFISKRERGPPPAPTTRFSRLRCFPLIVLAGSFRNHREWAAATAPVPDWGGYLQRLVIPMSKWDSTAKETGVALRWMPGRVVSRPSAQLAGRSLTHGVALSLSHENGEPPESRGWLAVFSGTMLITTPVAPPAAPPTITTTPTQKTTANGTVALGATIR